MKNILRVGLMASCLMANAAMAADSVKIGFLTTLSGPQAVMGNPMRDGANLALEQLGGKVGGLPAEIIFGDDQQKPDVERQLAERMIQKDHVSFITGLLASNGLLAIVQPVVKSGTILISANAGPHELAGEQCSPYFFAVSQQNDQPATAMGTYMAQQKIDDVYIMAPNYAAGKDMLSGFKRGYTGHIVGEAYTTFGQLDYQAEISQIQAAKPKAVFVFYPGGMGIQFVKQYAQSGLRDTVPLYSVNSIDAASLPAVQDAAAGNWEASDWAASLDIPRSKEFVAAFQKKYGYTPANYAARAYDSIFLIDSAVRAVGGNLDDKKALIAAMERANFPSVKGAFHFNSNHFPIQDFYLLHVEKQDGAWEMQVKQTILHDNKDAYSGDCHMAPPG